VASGYIQVPGIDVSESFAPVRNDVSFRIMLIVKLVWNMTCTVVDIEKAFLQRYLDEEIYLEVPKGLTIGENEKLILLKTIYGLVQRSREFYEKLINFLKVIGFYGRKFYPCLWTLWDKEVNNMIIIGKEENAVSLTDDLKNHEFNLKVERNNNENLSCYIEESKHKVKLTMIQPHFS
jgi:hypothetical protein